MEQNQLLDVLQHLLSEKDARTVALIASVAELMKQQRQEIRILEEEQKVRDQKWRQLNDAMYMDTHTSCSSCGLLPRKRSREEFEEEDNDKNEQKKEEGIYVKEQKKILRYIRRSKL